MQRNRRARVSQLTVQDNVGGQRPMTECTTRCTLTRIGYGSQRPCRGPLISAKNKKPQLQWAKGQKHWRVKKTLPGLMNPGSCYFTLMGGLGYLENHMSICIHHAAFQHCRLVVVVWGVFSWHTLGPLIKAELRLNTTGYLNIFANQAHPLMAAVYPSVKGLFSAG